MDWKQAEDFVAEFLSKRKFIILQRNLRFSHDEIDIVAKKLGKIFAFEVRLRSNRTSDEVWSYLSQLKYYRLQRSARSLGAVYKRSIYVRVAIVTSQPYQPTKVRILNPSKFTY